MLENRLLELMEQVKLILRDAEKFDKGNSSAGVRVRKDLMSATKEIKEIRQIILDAKKNRSDENQEIL